MEEGPTVETRSVGAVLEKIREIVMENKKKLVKPKHVEIFDLKEICEVLRKIELPSLSRL